MKSLKVSALPGLSNFILKQDVSSDVPPTGGAQLHDSPHQPTNTDFKSVQTCKQASELGLQALRISSRLNYWASEKRGQVSWSRTWCPPAELRQPMTASQQSETGALSLVSAGTGCFNTPVVPVKAVSDQRGSSTPRHGCHSTMLLGNGILKLPVIRQTQQLE